MKMDRSYPGREASLYAQVQLQRRKRQPLGWLEAKAAGPSYQEGWARVVGMCVVGLDCLKVLMPAIELDYQKVWTL